MDKRPRRRLSALPKLPDQFFVLTCTVRGVKEPQKGHRPDWVAGLVSETISEQTMRLVGLDED